MFDPARPIMSITMNKERDETLIVFFGGFIKNPSEALIRTMLNEHSKWIIKYPNLSYYKNMSDLEIYYETLIFNPHQMLSLLSNDESIKDEVLDKDINDIFFRVNIDNQIITTFEYTLYNLLKEDFVKKCYIYKENDFYNYEIEYIQKSFENNEKIELVESTDFVDLFKKVNPTTCFILDPAFVLDYVVNNLSVEEKQNKLFIILNNIDVLEVSETDDNDLEHIAYNQKYLDRLKDINNEGIFGVSTMYNLPIHLPNDIEEEEYEEEDDDFDDTEYENSSYTDILKLIQDDI